MKPVILSGLSGITIMGGVMFLTLVVVLYLVAKAIMRWLDNRRGDDGQ